MFERRRKYKRKNLYYYLDVYKEGTDQLVGHILDITPDGVLVMSENEFEVNSYQKLSIKLPKKTLNDTEIDVEGVVMHSARGQNPDFFESGIRFENLSDITIGRIHRIIKEYGFSD